MTASNVCSIGSRLSKYQPEIYFGCSQAVSYRQAGLCRRDEHGHPVPVVLLHGIGSGSASWLYQFESLASRYKLIAWDAPGYGDSSMIGKAGANADDYAAVLYQFLKGLKLNRIHLVGHSLGALIAGAFAKAYPETLASLTLVDPASGYGHEALEVREGAVSNRSGVIEAMGPDGLSQSRASNLLSEDSNADALALVQWNMRRLRYGGYNQAIRLLADGNLLADAKQYDGKVLVMCGARDHITPPEKAKKVCAEYVNGTYEEISGAGHAAYIDRPEEFNQKLCRFIESV